MASKILPPLGGASAQRIRAWTPASPRQQGQAGAESVLQRGSPRWGNTEESSGGLRLLSALIRPHTWPPCPHTPTPPFALTLLNMPPGPQSFLQDSPPQAFLPSRAAHAPFMSLAHFWQHSHPPPRPSRGAVPMSCHPVTGEVSAWAILKTTPQSQTSLFFQVLGCICGFFLFSHGAWP